METEIQTAIMHARETLEDIARWSDGTRMETVMPDINEALIVIDTEYLEPESLDSAIDILTQAFKRLRKQACYSLFSGPQAMLDAAVAHLQDARAAMDW